MEFKKKLRNRLLIHIGWGFLGLALIIVWLVSGSKNEFFFPFGVALITISVLRTIRYQKITKDEKTIRRQELAENDERYRMMSERARSWAFSLYILLSGIAVIVLSVLGHHDQARPVAWSVCIMTLLYWLCWLIIQKKY